MSKDSIRFSRQRGPVPIEIAPGEVALFESHHHEQFTMEADVWSFHKACRVGIGHGKIESSEGSFDITKGDLLLLPANLPHRFIDDPGDPLTLVMFCISPDLLSEPTFTEGEELWFKALKTLPPGRPGMARNGFHEQKIQDLYRFGLHEQDQGQIGAGVQMKTAFMQLMVEIARGACMPREGQSAPVQKTIEGALSYIDANLTTPIRLNEVAEQCGISSRRFSDLFKSHTGMTLVSYLNQKRVDHACQRIDETGHILYACYESGFNDPGYFYRVFRKIKGMTPGEYRKQAV